MTVFMADTGADTGRNIQKRKRKGASLNCKKTENIVKRNRKKKQGMS